jgi:short-subunit dehydrogenase
MFDFGGKTVLITGASYGLGEEFAYAFAKAKADLILTARSEKLLQAVAKTCTEYGSKVTVVTGDVAVESDVKAVIETGLTAHGQIDVLINNAGIADARGVAAEQFDAETFNRILSVDLAGAFYFARDCGRHMLQRGCGSIVNIWAANGLTVA